jgi:hypothetical protein
MDRRELLKKAGIGSFALAALPALGHLQASSAEAQGRGTSSGGQTNFHFVSLSDAATIEGVHHRMIMAGDGVVTRNNVVGGGSFTHVDAATPPPSTIFATGIWVAREFVSLTIIGTYGVFAAGILEMIVDLLPEGGSAVEATLEVTCNLGPAGLINPGKAEGFILTIPDAPFGPFTPVLGLTLLTTSHEPPG